MTDKKTQEYLDLLDETIQLEEQEEFKEDSEEYRQSQGRIFDFEAIKGIVTSWPIILKALEEANENIDNFIKSKAQPDVASYCSENRCKEAKAQIRNLLADKNEAIDIKKDLPKLATDILNMFLKEDIDQYGLLMEILYKFHEIPMK